MPRPIHRFLTLSVAAALCLVAASLPRSASAEDLALTIRPEGLNQIATAATRFFPDRIEVPETLTKQLVDCPFTTEDTVATVSDIVAEVGWNHMTLNVVDGMLVVDANINFDLGLHLTAVNFYACFGTIDCHTSVSTTGLHIVAKLALMSGLDGRVTLANSRVGVNLDMTNFNLDVQGCALGNLVEVVSDFLGNWVLNQLQAPIEDAVGRVLSDKVAGLDFVLPEQIDRNGFVLKPSLDQLSLSDVEGIKIAGSVAVSGTGGANHSKSLPAPTQSPLPSSFSEGGIALAVSDRLLTDSLYAAYQAGVFSNLLSEAIPSITLSQDGVAQKLGLPAGTSVQVALSLGAAPTVEFGRNEGQRARLAIPDMQVQLTVASPGAPEGRLLIEAGAVIDARFSVREGALMVAVNDLVLEKFQITVASGSIEPDPVRMQKFIREIAVPMLSDRLASMPLAPVLSAMPGSFVWVRGLETAGGWLRLGVDLVLPDLGDLSAPETTLPALRLVAAGLSTVPVSGTDNSTPLPLLRYMAWLDGEPLSDEPVFGEALRFSAAEGSHVLEVAAVDLNGNQDPTPSRRELIVDGTPPQLVITVAPEAVVQGGVVTASWEASDDKGGARTRWEVRVAANGGVREVVASGEGSAQGELSLSDLPQGELYVLHLIAEDQAGNVSSEEFGFAFEQGGGCSAAGNQNAGSWFFAMLLLLVLMRRRDEDSDLVSILLPALKK